MDAFNDLGELPEGAEPTPGLLRAPAHFVDYREHGVSSDAALGSRATVADGGEGRFDDPGSSKVGPVRGGEVVEREQLVAVTGQAGGGLGVLVIVVLQPLVEGPLGVRPRLGHPDLVQPLLGLGMAGLREAIQDVPGLVEPAALGTGL